MPGEDGYVEGGEEQDVPSRSASTDGRLTGNPMEQISQAAGRTSRRSQEQTGLLNWSAPAHRQQPNPTV